MASSDRRKVVAGMLGLAGVGFAPSLLGAQSQSDLARIYQPALPGGKVRTYYIAAEEVMWDYAPAGRDLVMGHDFMDEQRVWVERSASTIGRTYKKARFVEYTNDTFTTQKPVPAGFEHLGILGPVIRAEVGDVIRVIFRNKASRAYSMHPHGVLYLKADEGAPYNDGTSGAEKRDDEVRPGQTQIYVWQVPERSGPGPRDPSSLVWLYHSHVSEPKDTNAGLIGAIVISRRGRAHPDGRPRDVDREIVLLWKIFNETTSWYLEENAKAAGIDMAALDKDSSARQRFDEGNKKHAVNGYIFGSIPMMVMRQGERVRWYSMALGTEADIHTPHWHGNTLLVDGRRRDVVSLLPADTLVADMVPDNPGIWMLHCHVDDHQIGGMEARFQVLPRGAPAKKG